MRKLIVTTLVLFIVVSASAIADLEGDKVAVREAVLDYIEGWYAGDAERMERALHPDLAKRIVVEKDGDSVTVRMRFTLVGLDAVPRSAVWKGAPLETYATGSNGDVASGSRLDGDAVALVAWLRSLSVFSCRALFRPLVCSTIAAPVQLRFDVLSLSLSLFASFVRHLQKTRIVKNC